MNIMSTQSLPDAEALYAVLLGKIRTARDRDFSLIGIHTGGVWLAQRLYQDLFISQTTISAESVDKYGTLNVSFYRDDFDKVGLHTQKKSSEIPFAVDGAHILLVDDVLQSGRTIRAAINELFDYGRPASISLAVLVDRGGRELPVCAQYVGATLLLPDEKILVFNRDERGEFFLSTEHKDGTASKDTPA